MEKIEALAKYLECEVDDLEELTYDTWGMTTFEYGEEVYAIATDEEAEAACLENIKDSAWAFNASFILEECDLPFSGEESLKQMQEKSCEGANEFILSLIEKTCGIEQFTEDAISADGRGHFLSSYDGEENEEGEYFIYRIN
jgi:hypothetical protein